MNTAPEIRRGDVVLVPFPYVTDFRKAKTRPALVIQNDIGNRYGSTVIVALISSSVPEKRYPMHYQILSPSPIAKAAGLSPQRSDQGIGWGSRLQLGSSPHVIDRTIAESNPHLPGVAVSNR